MPVIIVTHLVLSVHERPEKISWMVDASACLACLSPTLIPLLSLISLGVRLGVLTLESSQEGI